MNFLYMAKWLHILLSHKLVAGLVKSMALSKNLTVVTFSWLRKETHSLNMK